MEEVVEKKKRGRKPKSESIVSETDTSDLTEDVEEQTESIKPLFHNTYAGFDLMADDFDIVDQTKESLMSLVANKKNRGVSILDHFNFDGPCLPFKHFGLQLATRMKGLPSGKLYELIAKEGLGKSTLMFTLAGYGLTSSIPSIYVETENKLMLQPRIERCLHNNREMAHKMAGKIIMAQAFNLSQCWDTIRAEVDALRRKNRKVIPKPVPIFIVLDTFSKLLSNEEAVGRLTYGDFTDTKKFKESGEAANFGHAKFSHIWCRELPLWLREENCILFVVSHKNDKVDMSFGAMFASTKFDKTKIGGNAFNQNAAAQFMISRKGFYKQSEETVGEILTITVVKNSYGPGNSELEYNLINKHNSDTDTEQEMALDFDTGLANFLVEEKLLDLSILRKRYTSPSLNLSNATATQFSEVFHQNTDLINFIGNKIQIAGY